jgi:hypothetical protein
MVRVRCLHLVAKKLIDGSVSFRDVICRENILLMVFFKYSIKIQTCNTVSGYGRRRSVSKTTTDYSFEICVRSVLITFAKYMVALFAIGVLYLAALSVPYPVPIPSSWDAIAGTGWELEAQVPAIASHVYFAAVPTSIFDVNNQVFIPKNISIH